MPSSLLKIDGEFKEGQDGGHMSVHNPQFLLRLSSKAKVKMTQKLTSVDKDWGKCCVFGLYQTDSYLTSTKGVPVATQSKYLTSDSCSHEAELEAGAYIVLCCSPTYKPKNPEKNAHIHAGPMTFTVDHAPPGSTLEVAKLMGVTLKKTLAFKGNGCGGYGSYKNPQFFLNLKKKSAVSINMKVSLPNPKIAVCVWMLPMDPATDFNPKDGKPQRMANFDQKHPGFHASRYLSSGAVDLELSKPQEVGTYCILTMTNNKEPREVTVEVLVKDDPDATLDGKEIAEVKEKIEESYESILHSGGPEKKEIARDCVLEKAYSIQAAHKVVDKITVECKKKNQANGGKETNRIALFKDPDFSHARSSLNTDTSKKTVGKEVEGWLRPHEIVERPELFSAGIDSSDIAQGSLGNCWFCAVVSAIATRPDKITKLFYPTTYNPAGIYSVSLWNGFEWVAVIIDDALPCSSTGMQVFARGVDKSEFWFPLVEKAAAKLVGSYQMLMGRNSTLGSLGLMELLTGGKGHHLAANPKDDAWFPTLRDYLSRGWICSIASETGAGSGIVENHAYTPIAVHEAKGGKLQLIRVRNTWGHGEWKGAYGDHDPIWKKDKALAKACDMERGAVEDGMFWMTRKDFEDNFENMNFCAFPSDNFPHETKLEGIQVDDPAAMKKPASNILQNEQILMETDGQEGAGNEINIRLRLGNAEDRHHWHHFYVFAVPAKGDATTSVSRNLALDPKNAYFTAKSGTGEVTGEVKLPASGPREYIIVPVNSYSTTTTSSSKGQQPPLPIYSIVVQSKKPIKSLQRLKKGFSSEMGHTLATATTYNSKENPCLKLEVLEDCKYVSISYHAVSGGPDDGKQAVQMFLYKNSTTAHTKPPKSGEESVLEESKYLLSDSVTVERKAEAGGLQRGEYYIWLRMQKGKAGEKMKFSTASDAQVKLSVLH